jgi:hypothetical protein
MLAEESERVSERVNSHNRCRLPPARGGDMPDFKISAAPRRGRRAGGALQYFMQRP